MCSHLKDSISINAGLAEQLQPVIMVCRHCLRRTISRCCPAYLYTDDEDLLLTLVVTNHQRRRFHARLRVGEEIKSVLYIIDAPDIINVCHYGALIGIEPVGAADDDTLPLLSLEMGIHVRTQAQAPHYH